MVRLCCPDQTEVMDGEKEHRFGVGVPMSFFRFILVMAVAVAGMTSVKAEAFEGAIDLTSFEAEGPCRIGSMGRFNAQHRRLAS